MQAIEATVPMERRQQERSDTFLILEFRPFKWTQEYSVGTTRNLSFHGFSMECSNSGLHPGNVLEFTLKHPYSNMSFTALGTIVWKKEGWYHVTAGIELNPEDEANQTKLATMLREPANMPSVMGLQNTAAEEPGGGDKTEIITECKNGTEGEKIFRAAPEQSEAFCKEYEVQRKGPVPHVTQLTPHENPSANTDRRKKYLSYAFSVVIALISLFVILDVNSGNMRERFILPGSGEKTVKVSREKASSVHPPSDEPQKLNTLAAFPGSKPSDNEIERTEERARILAVLGGDVFRSGQTHVNKNLMHTINEIFPAIEAERDSHVLIEGHTSNIHIKPSTGDQFTYNMNLSYLRAKAVASLFVKKGLSQNRISVIGYGDTRPIESNETREGRSRNRRVEVKLIPGERAFR